MTADNDMATNWPNVPLDSVASDIRLLRIRFNILEDEMRIRWRTLDERMDAVERELEELVGD